MTSSVDVLIIGAGPVGLFLANECARRSLRWRIVEQRPRQSEHSKALAVMPRTLEIFDMAGLVVPFLEAANRMTSVAVVTHGHRLAQIPFAPPDTPYPFVAMVPQDVTEALLVRALRSRGGEVEYEISFVSASQDGDGVDVVLDHRGERVMVRAAFVVGCDGRIAPSGISSAFRSKALRTTRPSCWPISTPMKPSAATSCSCARTRTVRSRSFR
jgi:2-polyprenyl-6-methoxyphenol hydroxylase-like FAD-dependent oxidoreductase